VPGIKKQLAELFPNIKDDDIERIDAITTQKEISAYLKQLGQDIKK
jgi:hypothetical protein